MHMPADERGSALRDDIAHATGLILRTQIFAPTKQEGTTVHQSLANKQIAYPLHTNYQFVYPRRYISLKCVRSRSGCFGSGC